MRVGVAVVVVSVAFVASVSLGVTACGSVPDLRFGDDDDASAGASLDATLGAGDDAPASSSGGDDDSAPPPTGDDASNPIGAGDDAATDGNPITPIDGATPPDSPFDPCPNHAPIGATCCGTIECRPTSINYCNCAECGQCSSTQVCCMDKNGQFQKCEPTIGQCPKP